MSLEHDESLDTKDQDHESLSIMGQETNAELIRVLERQIEDGNGDIIKLKRARNSLLNISTCVPPEILGDIFSWILVRPGPNPDSELHFEPFSEGSYNFLLVCHHWFQVASRVPELWAYCGDTLEDWKEWFSRHPQPALLDLVLNEELSGVIQPSIDHTVQDALKDCVARDIIRQVHLLSHNGNLLSLVISLLTPEGDGLQRRSIESIDIRNPSGIFSSDISNFFARVRLPKLRSLLLQGPLILPSWDHLAQQTTLLTTLSLYIDRSPLLSPPPTTSQFFSILISNPGLQALSLYSDPVIPKDDDNRLVPQVTLRHLKHLYLKGELRSVVGVLERLVLPHPLESLQVVVLKFTVESLLRTLCPYIRLYFRCDRGLQDRLKLGARAFRNALGVSIENEHGVDGPIPFLARFRIYPTLDTPRDTLSNMCHDLVTAVPQLERMRVFNTDLPLNKLEDLLVSMPNIETLGLFDVTVSEGFLQPNSDGPYANTKLLPSLRSLRLRAISLSNDNWGPLMKYLGDRVSEGQTISLRISGAANRLHMCSEVVEEIRGLVGEFSCDSNTATCPLGRCKGGAEGLEGQDSLVAE